MSFIHRDTATTEAIAVAQNLFGLALLVVLSIALGLAPRAQAGASDVVGLWATGGSLVEVVQTGDTLQMIVVALEEPLDESGSPLVDANNPEESRRAQQILGMDLLSNYSLEQTREGKRWQGKIYDPESGSTYSSHMKKKGDVLEMRGYIGTPLLGKTKKFKPISRCRVDMLVMLQNAGITGYCGL